MPIISGALSCRTFRVAKHPPANYRETFPLQIKRNAFHAPRVDRGEMRSIGWVNPRRILETRIDLDEALFDSWLVLALRMDTISLNTRIYKARLFEEMARVRKETGRDRLGREEKATLEEKIRIEMAKTQTPATAFHEMAWNLKTGDAIFTGTGQTVGLAFQEIFTDTFDLAMEPCLPFLRARTGGEEAEPARPVASGDARPLRPRTHPRPRRTERRRGISRAAAPQRRCAPDGPYCHLEDRMGISRGMVIPSIP